MIILYFALITVPCLVLMIIALFYLFAGVRTYMVGSKEANRTKKISGANAIFASFLGVIAVFFLWMVLSKYFLYWGF